MCLVCPCVWAAFRFGLWRPVESVESFGSFRVFTGQSAMCSCNASNLWPQVALLIERPSSCCRSGPRRSPEAVLVEHSSYFCTTLLNSFDLFSISILQTFGTFRTFGATQRVTSWQGWLAVCAVAACAIIALCYARSMHSLPDRRKGSFGHLWGRVLSCRPRLHRGDVNSVYSV